MREALDRTRLPSGGCFLDLSNDSGYYVTRHAPVMAAFDEIVRKAPLVEAGVEKFTAAETLLFEILSWAAKVTPRVPQDYRKAAGVS